MHSMKSKCGALVGRKREKDLMVRGKILAIRGIKSGRAFLGVAGMFNACRHDGNRVLENVALTASGTFLEGKQAHSQPSCSVHHGPTSAQGQGIFGWRAYRTLYSMRKSRYLTISIRNINSSVSPFSSAKTMCCPRLYVIGSR